MLVSHPQPNSIVYSIPGINQGVFELIIHSGQLFLQPGIPAKQIGQLRFSCNLHNAPHTFTSGFFSPNFSLSISQISARSLPCFSMFLMFLYAANNVDGSEYPSLPASLPHDRSMRGTSYPPVPSLRLRGHIPVLPVLQMRSLRSGSLAGNHRSHHRNSPASALPCRLRCRLHPRGKLLRTSRSHCTFLRLWG